MSERLKIPSAISYVRKSAVESFTTSRVGTCKIVVDQWVTIPFVKGSMNFESETKKAAGGNITTTELTVNIQEDLSNSIPLIFKLDFEDSDTIIIGDTELQVSFEIEENLTRKRLKFSHKNWHKPYKLVL